MLLRLYPCSHTEEALDPFGVAELAKSSALGQIVLTYPEHIVGFQLQGLNFGSYLSLRDTLVL